MPGGAGLLVPVAEVVVLVLNAAVDPSVVTDRDEAMSVRCRSGVR